MMKKLIISLILTGFTPSVVATSVAGTATVNVVSSVVAAQFKQDNAGTKNLHQYLVRKRQCARVLKAGNKSSKIKALCNPFEGLYK